MGYQRRRMNPRLKQILIFLLVVCLGVGVGLMFTPIFHVQEVFCEGTVRLNAEELTAMVQEANGKNIFLVRLSDVRKTMEEIPMVEKASVRRVFPNRIKITIEECIPAGYLYQEETRQCVVVDLEGKVLDIINDARVEALLETYTPKEIIKEEKQEAPKPTEKPEEKAAPEEETQTQESEAAELRAYSVPLVVGVSVHKPEIGKIVHSKEKETLEQAFEVFRCLEEAGLLLKSTYLDLRNQTDIVLMIENRLEVQLGTTENLSYRLKFLAKVVTERMSATEHAVMDYRGSDIYVRPPEDGKDRMVPTSTPEPTKTASTTAKPAATATDKPEPTEPATQNSITTLGEDL